MALSSGLYCHLNHVAFRFQRLVGHLSRRATLQCLLDEWLFCLHKFAPDRWYCFLRYLLDAGSGLSHTCCGAPTRTAEQTMEDSIDDQLRGSAAKVLVDR